MPSLVTPQRRRREDDSEDEENNNLSEHTTPSSRQSQGSKRARLNTTSDASLSHTPLLPNGFLSAPNGESHTEILRSRRTNKEHQPGSIVRVKLANFVTYTAVEFFPGPSLNMVIGPNGTGKSTLVCAICLGLGWGPQHLGRAKEISEFVKHGLEDATIEIELAGDGKKLHRNPVIRCNIKREGNKSHFLINGKPSNKKQVQELARSFSIQIDNLCQFLPQDKVVEFAAMTPVELLRSTQRAVAPQEMIDLHEDLKKLRADQRKVQAENASDMDTLANLEGRQKMQEADVERMRERETIKERVKMLAAARPFAEYRRCRRIRTEAKDRRNDAAAQLQALKDEVEPSLRAVNEKQRYQDQIKYVADERKHLVEKADRKVESISARITALQESIKDFENEKEAEKKGNKQNKLESSRLEQIVARLKTQMEQQPVELDISAFNERRREKERAGQELQRQAKELQHQMSDLNRQGVDKNTRIEQARRDLANLESQAGQQNNKLAQVGRDSAKAWSWIQEHQGEFEKRVYGPPIVECSVKDPRFVNLVEGVFTKTDLICFTVQTRSDFKRLHSQLHQRMGLVEINIRTMTGGLDNFRPPIDEEERKRYGFDGWALDYMIGPEPVLAMLCAEGPRLHQAAVALQDTTAQQYEMLQDSPIQSWITSKSHYRINRRREYGPGAVSTQVRDLKPAQIWTSEPVDLTAKRDLQENIEGWSGEVKSIADSIENMKARIRQMKSEKDELEKEQKAIADEKAARQKAITEYKALPTRLAQQEEKLATVNKMMEGVKERYQDLENKQDAVTIEKGYLALDYAKAVEALRQTHNELHEAEIMLIEAKSDVEVLTERNSAVKHELEAKNREVEDLGKACEHAVTQARKLLVICQNIMTSADEATKEFLRNRSQEETLEELEVEIESENARLELMHEGNGSVIREFEQRQKRIDGLRARLEEVQNVLTEFDTRIKDAREQWEPKLDRLIKRISESFAYNMKQINCAGEVGVYKDEEDFDQWAIQIRVKFRESEPLTLLDSHRQSGGERAVSTIFYLMSLQSLTRSPFRVVDEINQGMDPRNERLVHARMVSIATGNDDQQFQLEEEGDGGGEEGGVSRGAGAGAGSGGGSQYFLITPKLLHGLQYERGMRVLCIASGEHMPKDQVKIDFRACVDLRRVIRAGG